MGNTLHILPRIAPVALLALSACGGGGGGLNSTPPPTATPTPAPTPAPAPAPSPTPTPASTFTTAEFNRSDGPGFHNAVAAWQRGASGTGVTIGIVDTGIDVDSPEFAGRIAPTSADVAGSRTIDAEDDHGTMVALVAAAARNDTGILGMAWNATLQVLRADTPGTCAATGGTDGPDCSFSDNAIAAGIDRAVASGARVVNLSLGGSNVNLALRNAISRAAASGVVVVVSAGNDGDSTDPAKNAAEPDPFASSIRQAGGGNVLIVGSVNENGAFSAFSNRAGSEAAWFLSALGERVCCVYENGVLKTTTNAQGTFVTVVSGTSFAAPQVSGAVALLAQAFPNLTGAQIVDLLLRTARDAGNSGTDATYGRGILDVAAAFAPQGTMSLAGTTVPVSLTATPGMTSPAMGDAARQATLGTVALDDYARAYAVDLAQGMRTAPVAQRLHDALAANGRGVSMGAGGVSLAFTVDGRTRSLAPMRLDRAEANQARVLAGSVLAKIAPGKSIAFGWAQGSAALAARLDGIDEPAFLIATGPAGETGFRQQVHGAVAYRQPLGRFGVAVRGDIGEALGSALDRGAFVSGRWQGDRIARFGIGIDRALGAVEARLGAEWLRETRTILGGRMNGVLGGTGGASTLFGDAGLTWRPHPAWRVGASARIGVTLPDRTDRLGGGSTLLSSAWAVDVRRLGVFGADDSMAFRLSQPLRVERGALRFVLPVDYDYATTSARFGVVPLSLVPRGRELMGEVAWQTPMAAGWLSASLFWRKDPGHYAEVPDDRGAALRWSTGF